MLDVKIHKHMLHRPRALVHLPGNISRSN